MKSRTVLQAKRLGIVSCHGDDTLDSIVRRMADDDISALVVTDSTGYLEGIITRSDVLRAYAHSEDWRADTVQQHMTRSVITVTPETRLVEAADLLVHKHIHRVVVVREEEGGHRPIAVISDSDLVCDMADMA
jgi:CBS domain-containing protein